MSSQQLTESEWVQLLLAAPTSAWQKVVAVRNKASIVRPYARAVLENADVSAC